MKIIDHLSDDIYRVDSAHVRRYDYQTFFHPTVVTEPLLTITLDNGEVHRWSGITAEQMNKEFSKIF